MDAWSIGIYTGASPLRLAPAPGIANPVLTAGDVTDVAADFVADPFMLWAGGAWHMFFEVMGGAPRRGLIGLAVSPDGLRWTYRGIVLAEPWHLSYPYVFAHGGELFMIPETLGAAAVRLYRADPFPGRWTLVRTLLPLAGADPSVVHHGGLWWLFVCTAPYRHDSLALYHAEELEGPWTEHPASPLVAGDPRAARPAGRVLLHAGNVLRFAQDCHPRYGTQVRAFAVSVLSPEDYREAEHPDSPVLTPAGRGWNGRRIHQLDAHPAPGGGWIACVDGFGGDPAGCSAV
jgi:hypothetical protein